MIQFRQILFSEIYKYKRTSLFTISLLLPFSTTILVFCYYLIDLENLVGVGVNPWLNYGRYIFMFYYLLYPLLAVQLAYGINNIEYKNNTIKLVLTQPAPVTYFYFSKIILLIVWISCSLLLAYSLFMLGGTILSFIDPQLGFQDFDVRGAIAVFFVKTFITAICIALIQFLISLYSQNFIVPFGIAFFLLVLGMALNSWELRYIFPYANNGIALRGYLTNSQILFTKEIIYSIIYSGIFLFLGYYSASNRLQIQEFMKNLKAKVSFL